MHQEQDKCTDDCIAPQLSRGPTIYWSTKGLKLYITCCSDPYIKFGVADYAELISMELTRGVDLGYS